MKDVILQRITDVELAEFCKKFDFDLQQITAYQLRIENTIDFYPKRNRYFVIPTQEWRTAKNIDDLRKALIDTMPEPEGDDNLETFRQWYLSLTQMEYSEYLQGQINMLSSVLKKLMSPKEYENLVTMSENDVEAHQNGQEKLV